MVEYSESEIQAVLAACSAEIDELLADYKKIKNLDSFEPVVSVYGIGNFGFVGIFFDNQENPLASVLTFEGTVLFTPYFPEENLAN